MDLVLGLFTHILSKRCCTVSVHEACPWVSASGYFSVSGVNSAKA